MSSSAIPSDVKSSASPSAVRHRLLEAVICGLALLLALRFVALWTHALPPMRVPILGNIAFTIVFTTFALLHAGTRLGWPRALGFFALSAVIPWAFEAAGVASGAVYGAYHYGDHLGPKLVGVPFTIPLAWFMMIYASWVVARLLLDGAAPSCRKTVARIVMAALTMTAWDALMDPGMSNAGVWVWEHGGPYFGVPEANFVGWFLTSATVCAAADFTIFRGGARTGVDDVSSLYEALPAAIYLVVAVDRFVDPGFPELRVTAVFGMGSLALLALARLALKPQRAASAPG